MPKKSNSRCGSELGFTQMRNWPSCDKRMKSKVHKHNQDSSSDADEGKEGKKHMHKIHPSEMLLSHTHGHHKAHLLKPRGIAGIFREALKKVTRKQES